MGRFLLLLAVLPLGARSETTKDQPLSAIAAASSDDTDANVAQVTADMLQSWHYSREKFDDTIASRFLDRYVDTLDYFHLYFLQSDVDQFNGYRDDLRSFTLKKHDLAPCWTIFDRFMERARERIDYVTNMLATEKMEFTGQERFAPNRHTLPYATNTDQVREFWRQEARCEYLDELLKQPNIAYQGKVAFDASGSATVALARDKMHPLSLEFLPAKFYGKDGREIARIEFSNGNSNGVAHLGLMLDAVHRSTNSLYSDKGDEIGSLTTHRLALAGTNETDSGSTRTFTTNLEAVIELKQKNIADVYKADDQSLRPDV